MYTATVIHGYRNGSKFGFPTANLRLDTPIDIENGVYAARVLVDNIIYKGMLYVGTRPTLNLTEKTYEVHLLHFSGNLYGKTLSFEIVEFIRPEEKFESVEALVEQLKRDREAVEAIPNVMIKKRILSVILLTFLFFSSLSAQKTTILYSQDDDGKVYTSIAEALQSEKPVYRLKITKLASRDSLPEELFQLTELRELTVKGRKLCLLNQNIGKLVHLQYLNLDHNQLLRLPETLGSLTDLRTLVISRNMIETLPESIGNLHQLVTIDAWSNPLFVLPHSISNISKTLQVLDLRQIPLTKWEYEAMEQLLPNTDIKFTDICECENRRDHD